uniref:Ankyrin repeat and SOCS box containing 16 n=1 Tax=Junco hyemalis TaxID=40217 RepID=A0A8C5ISU7_JUNHY
MAHESFAFSPSALRSLRLQRELLERDERRRALARGSAERRLPPGTPPSPPRRRQVCRDPAVHNALYAGDLRRVQSIFRDEATANVVLETVSEELVWSPEQGTGPGVLPFFSLLLSLPFPLQNRWGASTGVQLQVGSGEQGLWVLSPRRQHTSALRIAAARGYEDCARHLLLRGAAVDAVVGGRAPLHDSAAAPHPNCARLLLAFGADPNVLSADGSAPLHLCTAPHSLRYGCAELLLAHGAQVNLGTRDRQVTALHVAARQGLVAHVELYLHHGADPSVRTHQGETPLNAAAAAAERPEDSERFLRVAERLLEAGAEPGAAGRKGHTPLHNACANGHPAMARLLLRHGADATVPNGAGDTPMDCALRAVREYRQQRPEETLTLLLDHGALPAHPKMLRLCCQHPPALEVMLNVTGCPGFYASAVRMAGQPRRLQHLARVAIRRHLGARCCAAVPRLALPPPLRRYLQLPIEGLIS